MSDWVFEQNHHDIDSSSEARQGKFAKGCTGENINLAKHYCINGGGHDAFGGAQKWPALSLNVEFEAGNEEGRDKLVEKLKQFIDENIEECELQ